MNHPTAFLGLVYHKIVEIARRLRDIGAEINEIVLRTMKSERGSDEIFGVPPQMKLNPSSYPDEVGFHHEVISSHDSGIYSVCKDGFS